MFINDMYFMLSAAPYIPRHARNIRKSDHDKLSSLLANPYYKVARSISGLGLSCFLPILGPSAPPSSSGKAPGDGLSIS